MNPTQEKKKKMNNDIVLKSLEFYLNYLENDDHAPPLDETKEERERIKVMIDQAWEARKQGQIDALKYIKMCINHQRVVYKKEDYVLALDNILLDCNASLERLENGEDMRSLSTVM